MIGRQGLRSLALRRELLPYAAELRHWFGVSLADCCAMPADELSALMESLGQMPAPGWTLAVHANHEVMPRPGQRVLFVDDLRPEGG